MSRSLTSKLRFSLDDDDDDHDDDDDDEDDDNDDDDVDIENNNDNDVEVDVVKDNAFLIAGDKRDLKFDNLAGQYGMLDGQTDTPDYRDVLDTS